LSKALFSTSQLALARCSILLTTSLELVGNVLGTELLRLLIVDGLDEDTLVLVHVTLHSEIQLAVEVEINLLAISVLLQQTSEYTKAAHPQDLGRETSLAGTTALTISGVATLCLGLGRCTGTRPGVHVGWFANDETILDELSYALSCNKGREGLAES
jgi:hypothetical protein